MSDAIEPAVGAMSADVARVATDEGRLAAKIQSEHLVATEGQVSLLVQISGIARELHTLRMMLIDSGVIDGAAYMKRLADETEAELAE